MITLRHFLSATLLLLSCHVWAQIQTQTQTLYVPDGISGIGTSLNPDGRINFNVGIGTNNPLQKLHINGAIRGNGTAGSLRVQTDYGYLDLGAQNANRAHIYTDRVGIEFNKDLFLNTKMITSNASEIEFHNIWVNGNVTWNYTPLKLVKNDATLNGNVTLTTGHLRLDRGNICMNSGKWITIGPVSASGLPLVDTPRLALHHNGVHAYVDFADNMHFRANLN